MRAVSSATLALGFAVTLVVASGAASGAQAASFVFTTGNPDGLLAAASRPASAGAKETEAADDFVVTLPTKITSASFTGLLPRGASVSDVDVEIYRVFPKDSSFPASGHVPTRTNSPSDVAFESRDAASGDLTFSTSALTLDFTAANSVDLGIHPIPGESTLGEGPVTGDETRFDVTFTTPFLLPADHYFLVPQVQLDDGHFLWLSAPRPIVSPGTPFPPGFTDLQAWIRNEDLDPDWLRIGTDITAQGPFNMSFSLAGTTVPEPATWALMIGGLGLAGAALRRRRATLA